MFLEQTRTSPQRQKFFEENGRFGSGVPAGGFVRPATSRNAASDERPRKWAEAILFRISSLALSGLSNKRLSPFVASTKHGPKKGKPKGQKVDSL